MEARSRKYYGKQAAASSPERTRVWTEPPPPVKSPAPPSPQYRGRRIPVVYYLCRNHHLEHPHFIEVPISSPEGLFLRDVINRLNAVRGKGMASRYSWSCKRSYKNGFVWYDLSEDDLVLPAHGDEYILKGSELLDKSPTDRANQRNSNLKQTHQEFPSSCRNQDASSSSSSPKTHIKESKSHLPPPPPSPPPHFQDDASRASSGNMSPMPSPCSPISSKYRVHKLNQATDASTQTEDRPVVRRRAISSVDDALDLDLEMWCRKPPRIQRSHEHLDITLAEASPTPTSFSTPSFRGKTETLGSLIRADIGEMNSFRILEEEQVFVPTKVRQKAVDIVMQLVTCGAISVKDHQSFGLIPTYKPVFTHENLPSPVNCGNARFSGLREDKEYFSGSLIEIKNHKEGEVVPALNRSSSNNAERNCKLNPVDEEKVIDSASLKCLPRTIKIISSKQSKGGQIMSPISDGPRNSSARQDYSPTVTFHSPNSVSKSFSDASFEKGSSMRLESFKEEREKVINIEERLTSGAKVIIQSAAV